MKRLPSFLLTLILAAGAYAQDPAQPARPPAQQPAAGTLEGDFAAIVALENDLRRMPPSNPLKRGLVDDLGVKCSAFIDTHGAAASADQIGKAVANWIAVSNSKGPEGEAAVLARLPALKALPNLPPPVQKMIAGLEAAANIKPGNQAPNWNAVDIHDGTPVTLESLRGKLVLMDFWATWCGPCVALMNRELQPLHQRYASNEGFVLLGLGMPWRGETAEKEVAFGNEKGFHWKKVFDASGDSATAYGVNGIPFLCLVDGEGKILVAGSGFAVIEEVKRILTERLGPGTPPATPAPGAPAAPGGGH